jgi:transcriptional regulator with XRE-family HTH domain
MAGVAPHERLERARAERGEDLETLSRRTGVRVHHLRAIEKGHFAELPPGIFARGAIRSFAAAYGLDADELLEDCDALLPGVDDPLVALRRVHGVRAVPAVDAAPRPAAAPRWRTLVPAALDALTAGVLLAVACAVAALVAGVPIAALRASAPSFAGVGLLAAAGYFISSLTLRAASRSARPPAPLPSPPRRRGPSPAPWLLAHPAAAAPPPTLRRSQG